MADRRLSIRLDANLQQRLRRLAVRSGRTMSAFVRQVLEGYCESNGNKPGRTCYDIAKKVGYIGSAKSLPADASTNPKYLEGMGEDS